MPIAVADFQTFLLNASAGQINVALRNPQTGVLPTPTQISAFLNWPICDALFQMGFQPASVANIVDADLLQVPDANLPRMMAVGLLQCKRHIRGQLALVDQSVGTGKQSLSDLAKQLDREIADMEKDVHSRFGVRPAAPVIKPMHSAPDKGMGGLYPDAPRPRRYERHDGFDFA